MPAVAGKEIKMDKYNQDDYNFFEDDEFQAFLKSELGGKFVPRYKFFTILNWCKREYKDRCNYVRLLSDFGHYRIIVADMIYKKYTQGWKFLSALFFIACPLRFSLT